MAHPDGCVWCAPQGHELVSRCCMLEPENEDVLLLQEKWRVLRTTALQVCCDVLCRCCRGSCSCVPEGCRAASALSCLQIRESLHGREAEFRLQLTRELAQLKLDVKLLVGSWAQRGPSAAGAARWCMLCCPQPCMW